MDPIYVTGHRNPDTDSIVAALAYAALRNACGDREYEAACLGEPSDETKLILDRFGFNPPKRIYNMYNQIRDLDFLTPPVLSTAVTVGRAWDIMQEQKIGTLPVANEDGTLYGILSRDNVATYHMSLITESYLQEVPLFNVLGRGLRGIQRAVEDGVSVVITTQCLYDSSDLRVYQVGNKLLDLGVIQARDMTSEAAMAKLMWGLGQGYGQAQIAELFTQNIAGEITTG